MSLLLLGNGSNVKLPQFIYGDKQQKKAWKSKYASLTSEGKRIKHLGFRDDLMCREIVIKRNKV